MQVDRYLPTLVAALLAALSGGCMKPQALQAQEAYPGEQVIASDATADPAHLPGDSLEALPEKPQGWDRLKPSNLWSSAKDASGFGPDPALARAQMQEGDELFRRGQYSEAAKKYKVAANRWPDSGLEEEALFMLGESYFFSDQYPKAHDTYDQLVIKFANTRHLDKVVARQFAIARYWDEYNLARPRWPITPNLVDKTRPRFDTGGNALHAYDRVRLNDPQGLLADDAIMATATSYFAKARYEDADYYYGLLRKEYPKSEHLLQAYLLGLQCKLRSYQGPGYDSSPLDDAEELIDQMLVQFPNELADERERLIAAKQGVHANRAQRDYLLAQFYEKGEHYGAARFYYDEIVKSYPDSSFANESRERLAQIQGEPDNPPNRLAWLDTIFDEGYRRDQINKYQEQTAIARQQKESGTVQR